MVDRQLLQRVGVNGVVGPLVAALDVHEAGVDELLHVVREQRLVDVEQRDQLALADRLLAAPKHVEDPDAHWLGQRLRRGGDALGIKREVQAGGRRAAVGCGGTGGKSREGRAHINVRWFNIGPA